MELFKHSIALPLAERPIKSLLFASIGLLISGLLIGCGFLFRTYTISMPSNSWEMARQLGLPFVYAELAVIFFAIRNGLKLKNIWLQVPSPARYAAALFLSTYWVGSVFFSEVKFAAVTHNIITAIHIIFGAAIYHYIAPATFVAVRQMAKWFAVGLLIFCFMTAAAFLNHPPLSSMPQNQIIWQFAIPGFISVRLFGAFCGALFCFFIALLFVDEEQCEDSIWHYLWVTLSAGMMIWSGTRAAVLGAVISIGFIALAYKFRPKVKTLLATAASIVVATLLAVLLIPYGSTDFMLFAPGDVASSDAATGGRLSYWKATWDAYQTVPFFGAGPFATSWILPPDIFRHVQPHNVILQFLITWGLIGALPAFMLLGISLWHAYRIAFRNRVILPLLAMLNCLLVMSLFDGTLHFAQHFMLAMLCYGVIFASTKKQIATEIS